MTMYCFSFLLTIYVLFLQGVTQNYQCMDWLYNKEKIKVNLQCNLFTLELIEEVLKNYLIYQFNNPEYPNKNLPKMLPQL